MGDWIARAINPAKNHTQKDAAESRVSGRGPWGEFQDWPRRKARPQMANELVPAPSVELIRASNVPALLARMTSDRGGQFFQI
jgi:hypothetical protein